MESKIIEIFNKIVYNVLSALYQPFWAAVLLAFLTMFLYLYGKEHGWKKNNFIRNREYPKVCVNLQTDVR